MKRILIVVDMQNDFIDGTLGSNYAMDIVPNVCALIKEATANDCKVIFTLDTHFEDYLSTLEGQRLPVTHCIQGSWGHALEESVLHCKADGMITLEKNTFGSVALGEVMSPYMQPDTIVELCGLCTDICVISNAMLVKAAYPNNLIRVYKNACAGITPESHENALNAMRMCHIDIVE